MTTSQTNNSKWVAICNSNNKMITMRLILKFVENLVRILRLIIPDEKLRSLDEYIAEQKAEEVIQGRIQQLAICKVLVNIHKKDLFILVRAYTNLG